MKTWALAEVVVQDSRFRISGSGIRNWDSGLRGPDVGLGRGGVRGEGKALFTKAKVRAPKT